MPRRRRGGRGRRGRSTGSFIMAQFPFSAVVGTSLSLTKKLLDLPTRMNWRPVQFMCEFSPGYTVGTSTVPGFYFPACLQLQYTERTALLGTSRNVVATTTPRKVTMRIPPSADWLSWSLEDSYQFGILMVECLGKVTADGNNNVVRGIVHVKVQLQQETITVACPTLLTNDPSESSSSPFASI